MKKKIKQRRLLHGKAPSPSAPPLVCPKNHHKKLDKKIDKNGTFILQHCPVNHIAAKGHTFFPWNLVRIRQRSHLFPVQSNIKTKGEKNRAKKVLAWAKRRDLQHRRQPVPKITTKNQTKKRNKKDKGHTFFCQKQYKNQSEKKIEQRRPLSG